MLNPSVTVSPVGALQNSCAHADLEKIRGETPVASIPARPPFRTPRRLKALDELVISSSLGGGSRRIARPLNASGHYRRLRKASQYLIDIACSFCKCLHLHCFRFVNSMTMGVELACTHWPQDKFEAPRQRRVAGCLGPPRRHFSELSQSHRTQ